MQMSNLSRVNSLADKLVDLKQKLRIVKDGRNGGLSITIQSSYQSDDFVNLIRPYIIAELEKDISETENELANLGVVFD